MRTSSSGASIFKGNYKIYNMLPYLIILLFLATLPFYTPLYFHSIMVKFLIFALFAISFDLIFGYVGMLSLGHAAYFGTGAYVAAVLAYHYDISSFWISAPLSIIAAMIMAAALGIFALRVSGIYFLLVTFAMGQMLYGIAWNWSFLNTPGMQGIAGIARPTIGLAGFSWTHTTFYFFILIIFIACYILLNRIVNSPFGLSLKGIREGEERMKALGFNTWLYKYTTFIIAAGFAGLAGCIFAYYNSMVNPMHLGVNTSFLPMAMAIIGGMGTLFGPVVGAAVLVFAEHYLSIAMMERWPLFLGGSFVLIIMFARKGLAVYIADSIRKVVKNVWKY